MTFNSNGESANNDVDKKAIFETPDVELFDSENEIKPTKTACLEVNTQLDNGVPIAFTLEVEYDGDAREFSINDLLEDSSFIDELTVTNSRIATDT